MSVALGHALRSPTPKGLAALQIIGASILLLATIYVRGPAIETYVRETLIERVDRWIYCGGCFLGTRLSWLHLRGRDADG